jgi:hypothetical protein
MLDAVSGYRDDLDAAQARIARLEAEVADLHAQLEQTPAQQARVAELRQRRADAIEAVRRTEAATRRALTIAGALGLAGGLVFVGIIASMGSSGHPLAAAALSVCVIAPVLAIMAFIGDARRNARAKDVTELDRRIAELSTRPERTRVSAAAPRARVAVETAVAADVDADDENPEGASPARRAR